MTPASPRLDRVWFEFLTLKYDEALTNFAFNFNLRRYILARGRYSSKFFTRSGLVHERDKAWGVLRTSNPPPLNILILFRVHRVSA